MEFIKTENGFAKYDEEGKLIAEITYASTSDPNVVEANHTFVDSSLRGQGVAGKLLNTLVNDMNKQNKKIKATCSYVVKKFEEDSSYDFINAEK
ncbi:GNAT family N-acetyltransferase [Gemella cuniculi]|uniref:GNAT family N-acetyltransferase n=1 Tax=Gemella cuniculi TaxID=150240 RepID=UPI00040B2D98|nr:GNAT family N-acetyltransferase [Gemella cuniculi]